MIVEVSEIRNVRNKEISCVRLDVLRFCIEALY